MALGRYPPRADVALAATLATYGFVEGLLLDVSTLELLGTLAATLPLAWRRRVPAPAVGLALAFVLLPGFVGSEAFGSVLPLPVIVVSAYTAGREATSGRVALLGAVAVGAAVAVSQEFAPPGDNSTAEDYVAIVVIVGGAAAAGHVMRSRQTENRRLHELTQQLAGERDLRARAAVAEERARVARELHDIVGHSVSLIAVQAAAAEELMGRDDDRARQAVRAVQETARSALGEMRRLVSMLRPDGEAPALTPQPGFADIPGLVERARASGLAVELHEQGGHPQVSPGVDASAFRIVQEALTNVLKHAGTAPAEVRVQYGTDEVVIEVSNPDDNTAAGRSRWGGEGRGLLGMRERARIYGGTLDVDRRHGRYVVHARLPVEAPTE